MRSRGFIIVELLIVVVVIGILATITIVAYNGVKERAVAASVRSTIAQIGKQLEIEKTESGVYPNDLSGLVAPDDIDIQYRYTASTNTYCLTATKAAVSYALESNSAPREGGCAGHGVGGVAAITNHILNPSFETGSMTNGANIHYSGGTRSIMATGGAQGNQFTRAIFSRNDSLGWGQFTETLPVGVYTSSFYVRSSIAMNFYPYVEGTATKNTTASSGTVSLPPNTWVRIWITSNVTAPGNLKAGGYSGGYSSTPIVGSDYIDFDGYMTVLGTDVPAYADGDSSNWIWNDSPPTSTSTGPPL